MTKDLCSFNNVHQYITILNKQKKNEHDVSGWMIYKMEEFETAFHTKTEPSQVKFVQNDLHKYMQS